MPTAFIADPRAPAASAPIVGVSSTLSTGLGGVARPVARLAERAEALHGRA
ncbi:MAG: hypothetical protein KDG89_14235 [Geminicoccaceae bacterium]|nr:hypothetical protein [Geminicoccaceae bacterium]